MAYVGVDGCPDGWLAVRLEEQGQPRARCFASFADVWQAHEDAELLLVDIPIGLREDTGQPRPCDAEARARLGAPRSASVFEPPVRAALEADTYARARAVNEERAAKSIPAPSWGIADKIREVDRFLRARPEAVDTVREAHPEVCLWALAGGRATRASKTGEPRAAFLERVGILEALGVDAVADLRAAGEQLACSGGIDDLVDAYVLALTASPATGELVGLPSDGEESRDPRGLPMRIWYAKPPSEDEE